MCTGARKGVSPHFNSSQKKLHRRASTYTLLSVSHSLRSSPLCVIMHKCRENRSNSGKNCKHFSQSSLKQVLVTIPSEMQQFNTPRALTVPGRTGGRRGSSSDSQPRAGGQVLLPSYLHPRQDLEHCWSSAGTTLPHTGDNPTSQGGFTTSLMFFQHSGNCFPIILFCADWIVSSSPDWHEEELPQMENFR